MMAADTAVAQSYELIVIGADPATAQCTIVMLTARADASDKAHAFASGADDYI